MERPTSRHTFLLHAMRARLAFAAAVALRVALRALCDIRATILFVAADLAHAPATGPGVITTSVRFNASGNVRNHAGRYAILADDRASAACGAAVSGSWIARRGAAPVFL